MKTLLALLLCASLVGNLLLFQRTAPKKQPTPTPAATPKAQPEAFTLNDAAWQKASTGDTTALQKIRDAGLPPEIERALLRAAIKEMYKPRLEALYPDQKERKYWDFDYFARFMPSNRGALVDLNKEMKDMLEKWAPPSSEERAQEAVNTSYLPAEKAKQLAAIEDDYRAMIADVRGPMGQGPVRIMLPEDREKLSYLEKEKAKELTALLTPEEMEEYIVRNSPSAVGLRYDLALFNPTEQEFRDLVRIRKTVLDDPYPAVATALTPEERSARSQAQEEADKQARATLGEQRYADYVRAKDFEYRTFAAITDHLQLPRERANEAFQIKNQLQQKYQTMARSTAEQREQTLTTLIQEADREFTRVLGPSGYAVYKQYGSLPRQVEALLKRPLPPSKPSG